MVIGLPSFPARHAPWPVATGQAPRQSDALAGLPSFSPKSFMNAMSP